jgi:phage terminase small subunit
MTLKQERFIKEIEKPTTKSIRQAALKAGYSENYANGLIHADIRKPNNKVAQWLERKYSKENITSEIEELKDACKSAEDRGNWARMLELQTKIAKLTNDNTLQQINVVSGVFSEEDKAKLLAKGIPQ